MHSSTARQLVAWNNIWFRMVKIQAELMDLIRFKIISFFIFVSHDVISYKTDMKFRITTKIFLLLHLFRNIQIGESLYFICKTRYDVWSPHIAFNLAVNNTVNPFGGSNNCSNWHFKLSFGIRRCIGTTNQRLLGPRIPHTRSAWKGMVTRATV
jgi:hypothetical protein